MNDDDFRRGDAVNGQHQYNDCLILGLALDQRGTAAQLTVSPSYPFSLGSRYLCRQLRAPMVAGSGHFYHNYVHGDVMLARYFLPILPIDKIRELYRTAITLALMFGVCLSMLGIAKGERAEEGAVFLVVLLAFTRAFGLETFGQSLGHGPADLVLVSFLLFLCLSRRSLSEGAAVLAAAVFGALTMVFELMTGGLPLGLATVIGLAWFALREPRARTVVLAAIAYLAAALSCLVTKFAAVGAIFGPSAMLGVIPALGTRAVGGAPDLPNQSLVVALLQGAESMMPGLGTMAILFVVIAVGFGSWTLSHRPSTPIRLLAMSNSPVILWLLIFRQHTLIHAWFMDRMFAWVIASGFAMFVLGKLRGNAALATVELT